MRHCETRHRNVDSTKPDLEPYAVTAPEVMSKLVEELGQHALMCANDKKKQNLETPELVSQDEVDNAYGRVKTFAGGHCPRCWVTQEKLVPLQVTARNESDTNFYKCGENECEFFGVFPKPEENQFRSNLP